MSDHDDFAFDAAPGIPAPLPKGESLLWQGRPDILPLAREAWKLNWIMAYMGLIVIWKAAGGAAEGGVLLAVARGLPYAMLMVAAAAVILFLAWAQSRATIYSITTARVLMRIGALSVTYNIPFRQIASASVSVTSSGHGTIALATKGETRLAYLQMWPHVRPWHLRAPEPALRCIADAAVVARILGDAAETRLSQPEVRLTAPLGAVAAE